MGVFLVSYANYATGGTELLHQFARCLIDNGVDSYMIYPDANGIDSPVPEPFLKYCVPYTSHYVDAADTVLVLTETQVHMADICKKGMVMFWWLSVDSYYNYPLVKERLLRGGGAWDVFGLKERKNALFFAQCQYAMDFLEQEMCIEDCHFLKDYINDEIMDLALRCRDALERDDICLYNPKKGGAEALQPVMEACRKDIQWIALRGFTPRQMALLMCKAKVYVDLGGHPGKDRMPREAAVCGCCVLTNRRGSAAYQEDVGIAPQYKIADEGNVEAILAKVYDLVDHYQDRREEYASYRAVIEGEKAEFLRDFQAALTLLRERAAESSKTALTE